MTPLDAFGDVLLGLLVGTLGTLIGAGGGFILLPILVFIDPHAPPETLTAISLAVVCVNASSGSLAYARIRRIDFRSGLIFTAAGMPGAVFGAWVTQVLDRRVFDPLLGVILIASACLVAFVPEQKTEVQAEHATRTLIERDGTTHMYAPRIGLGALVSLGVGFLSSLLGIGGGILHVPVMVYLLGFPTHVATATSHFVLAGLSLAGVLVHWREGTLIPALERILPIVVGVLIGAPLGARLSSHLHGRWILRSLAAALALVGIRLFIAR
jgi:uncharacterized membrane protein YfcA